jgi:hypothetical protein
MLGETRDRTAVQEFETKLLELWDRIYQYWLNSRTGPATSATMGAFGPQVKIKLYLKCFILKGKIKLYRILEIVSYFFQRKILWAFWNWKS